MALACGLSRAEPVHLDFLADSSLAANREWVLVHLSEIAGVRLLATNRARDL